MENLKKLLNLLFLLGGISSCVSPEYSKYVDPGRVDSEVRDILTNRGFERRQALLAVQEYEAFLSAYFKTKSDLKAEAMQRLGDLLMEITHQANRKARKLHEDQMEQARNGKTVQTQKFPLFDYSRPIQLYERFLVLYPGRAENDAVLYQLARAYFEEGRNEKSRSVLESLMKQYPSSPYYWEAAFRIGDSYFDLGLFQQAISRYRLILDHGNNPFIEKALYKLGWSNFKLRNYFGSIEMFRELLDHKSLPGETPGSFELSVDTFSDLDWELVEEVVRVMAISFDHLGGGDVLKDYLEKVGPRGYDTLLYRGLGDLYMAGGKTDEAVHVYRLLLQEDPFDEDAPHLHLSMIRAFDHSGRIREAAQARILFVQTFGPDGRWSRLRPSEDRGMLDIRLRETIYQLALYYHSKAQRGNDREDYEKAIHWYQTFSKTYPQARETPEVLFLLGEGLYELGRYRKAAEVYETVAYEYPHFPKGAEAGYGALMAYDELNQHQPETENEILSLMFNSGERFANTFPTDHRTPDVLLKMASLAYQKGQKDQAKAFSQKLVSLGGNINEPLKMAAFEILSVLFLEENDFSAAAQFARSALLQNPEQNQKRRELENLLANALFREAGRLKSEGDPPGAAQVYIQLYEEVPGSGIRDRALYEAAALLLEAGEEDRGKRLLEKLATDESSVQEKSLRRLGAFYEEKDTPAEAAKVFDRLSQLMEHGPEKSDILFHSAVLYERAGDWSEAEKRFRKIAQAYTDDPFRAIQAMFRSAEALSHLKKTEEAIQQYAAILDHYERQKISDPKIQYIVSKANLKLGRHEHQRFSQVYLRTPLEENLQRKDDRMSRALGFYRKASAFQIENITTEVSYRIGQLYEAYGKALFESERPAGLSPGPLKEYEFLLSERTRSWNEKAILSYEQNVERAQKGGLFDEWIRISYERLAILHPGVYQKSELREVIVRDPSD